MVESLQLDNPLAAFAATGAAATPKLAVLPQAAKINLRIRPEHIGRVEKSFGVELSTTPCRYRERHPRRAYWLGPDEWMLEGTAEDSMALCETLEKALVGTPHSIVDVSHRSVAFSIEGERAEFVINHGCPLDLNLSQFPVGMCTRTILGKAAILLSRSGAKIFHVDVWHSFAPYTWRLLEEARLEFCQESISMENV